MHIARLFPAKYGRSGAARGKMLIVVGVLR